MDAPKPTETTGPVVLTRPKRPAGRAFWIFALIGLVVALLAGGLFVYRDVSAPPPRTPEETVREFLSAVFLAGSPERVAPVVCASWDPAEAVARTTREIGTGVRVSWDELRVVASDPQRITMRARLGLRQADDIRPTTYNQWRFNLVNENGWKVCEARPFVV